MATLFSNISSTIATPTLLETFSSGSSFAINSALRSESTAANAPVKDTITLSKKATQQQNTSRGLSSQSFFTSYVNLLQEQQKAQTMISQDIAGTGNTSTSVLNRYQTLQYQQNTSDRLFNLKGDIFQSMLNTTA